MPCIVLEILLLDTTWKSGQASLQLTLWIQFRGLCLRCLWRQCIAQAIFCDCCLYSPLPWKLIQFLGSSHCRVGSHKNLKHSGRLQIHVLRKSCNREMSWKLSEYRTVCEYQHQRPLWLRLLYCISGTIVHCHGVLTLLKTFHPNTAGMLLEDK